MSTFLIFSVIRRITKICIVSVYSLFLISGCDKDDDNGDYAVKNSLSLFKLDNKNNNLDLASSDTIVSQTGVNGKFILVSGATGAAKGLDTIRMELYTAGDSLLNRVTLTSFFKPEYHLINTQLVIPASQKGKAYKVIVKVIDKTGTVIGTKTFYGVDVVTCDPVTPCVVNNQITIIVETPPGTPVNENISLFGSLNGWNRGDMTYKLHKNPDVPNCYCVTVPFPPGSDSWQLGEIFVTRGMWENDAVNNNNSAFIVQYANSDRGPLWKIKVPKWRDK